jgi:hypothetical protein
VTIAALLVGIASLAFSVWVTVAARRIYRARRRLYIASIFNPIVSHVQRDQRRR